MKPSLTDTSSVPIEVSIRKLKIGLYQAIIPLDTICYLKISGEANALKLFKFPPESDCSEVKEILNKYFDMAAKTKAMHEIQNVLTQNIKDQAKKDAMEKVTVMIRPTVVFEVKTILQQKVIPKAKEIANAAARSAAKNKANSFKGEMIAYACIPIYGYIKVHQLKKQVKQEAEDAATQAANKAARDFMQSAKGEIADITNKTVKKVYKEKKQQVRSAVKESIEIHLRKVLEASFHHK